MKNNILKFSNNCKAVKFTQKYHLESSKIWRTSQAKAASTQCYHHEIAVTHPARAIFVSYSKMQAVLEKK